MNERDELNPLTDDEARQLALLLKRYVLHDLDQFATWRTGAPAGEVYILVRREVFADEDPQCYTGIDHWRPSAETSTL